MRVLVEASTESEWVAQHLETLGHEVIVADPTFGPMYSERSRRIKTDRRDVAALADACHRGCYRAAHRRSASQRRVQAQLNVRRGLTDSRTRAISLARAITRGAGLRIRSGSSGSFLVRLATLELSPSIAETLAPLQRVIGVLNEELAAADDRCATIAVQDPVVARLTSVPGIGPITATAYVAALDNAARFGRPAQVASSDLRRWTHSSRGPLVIIQEASESCTPPDSTLRSRGHKALDQFIAQPLMITLVMIMLEGAGILPDH